VTSMDQLLILLDFDRKIIFHILLVLFIFPSLYGLDLVFVLGFGLKPWSFSGFSCYSLSSVLESHVLIFFAISLSRW
jgi:hypothetical protein